MTDLEFQHTEWKENWRDEYLRWVSGFANAEGGTLVIGKNDDGLVVGLKDAKKLLEELPNKIRDLLGIVVSVNLKCSGSKGFLEIVVDSYPNPISFRGHYYLRSGSTLQELKGASLDRFLLRRQGRTWDGVPVPGVKAGDLSTAVLPEGWTLAHLLGEHSSSPYNPAVANAFFRSGEIEAWGRGIQRIFQACHEAGTPMPLVRYEPNDLWLEFPFAVDYLAAMGGERKTTGSIGLDEKLDEKLGQRRAAILRLVRGNPKITVTGLARSLGISRTAADKNIQVLKTEGWLARIGPAKGGHWEVKKSARP